MLLSIIFFGLSCWFIYYMVSHRINNSIPKWLENAYYKSRNIKPANADINNVIHDGGIPIIATSLGLLLAPIILVLSFLSIWFPNNWGEYFTFSPTLPLITFSLGLFLVYWIGKFFGQYAQYYSGEFVEEEKKQDLRDAYGVKGWATEEEILYYLCSKNEAKKPPIENVTYGVPIGNFYYNWYQKGHMLTVGGAGSGKGVNLVIPALLSPRFFQVGISTVVLDPKGENAAVCAPNLIKEGYDVHIINPFHISQIMHLGNSRWNPFDCIERHEVKKMCDVLAYSLHNRTGGNDFFDNKCRQYISLYMRYAYHTNNKSIDWVYKKLMLTGVKRAEFLSEMSTDNNFSGQQEAENILTALEGETQKTEENIFGSIFEAINILGDDALRECMAASDFDMKEISKKPTAIFLCIKHDELRYYAPWVRMFTDFLIKTLTNHYNPQRKVLVLLDEFAQLGYVNEFKNSPAVLRGYNVTLWPIVQELGQLKSLYGDHWETFISNAAVKHWLGGGMDNTTAEYIEKRMPMDIKFVGSNADGSPREVQTKLMTAEQIMKMSGMIVEVSGIEKPLYLDKSPYYKHDILKRYASPNPFN